MSDQPSDPSEVVNTAGGSYIKGNINTKGGDFVGRDKNTNIFNYLFGSTPEASQYLRARKILLESVNKFWVEGVLRHSLHDEVLLTLGLEARPSVVDNRPWDMVLKTPHEPDRPLPPETKIIDIFDQQQNLLILGTPGSGKTTMLLELARDLITRAQQDVTQPIPVVLNLSSWAVYRQPIADWIIVELNTKYYISRKVAKTWLENDALLLLLDGLDEVKEIYRNTCVAAINAFRKTHIVNLAVCSRIMDYEALEQKLQFQGAVLIQLLTENQIASYLERLGSEFAVVHTSLRKDPVLLELAKVPLLLNIMAQAYRGTTSAALVQHDSLLAQRKHLFDTYIKQMFIRRNPTQLYSPQQTLHWLIWLTKNMFQRQQTVFLLEQLQSEWLETRTQVWLYRFTMGLIFGLIVGLSSGVIVGLLVGLLDTLIGGLIAGLIFGLISWVAGGLSIGLKGEINTVIPDELVVRSSRTIYRDPILGNSINGGIGGTTNIMSDLAFLVASLFFLWIDVIFFMLTTLGIEASIKHVILRSILTLYNRAPLNYTRFLDYCTDRILLRKVGGGYIFIHRLLLEHLASMTEEDIKRLAGSSISR